MGYLLDIHHMARATNEAWCVYCVLFWSLGRPEKVLVVVAARMRQAPV